MVITRGLKFAFLALLSASRLAAAPTFEGSNKRQGSLLTDRIKNVVVLIQENRSFDSIVGDFSYSSDINGLRNVKFCNPVNVTDPSQGTVCATPTAPNVAADDPNHSVSGDNMELFTTFHPNVLSNENMQGFVYEQEITFKTVNATRAAEAIEYYNENNLPTLRTLSEEFVLFDEWFCSVPGPTNPNRAYITAGTSYGHGSNDNAFNIAALPVRSVFQQLSERGISWINYYNSSFAPDSMFYSWTVSSGANITNVKPLTQFYSDAKAGTLPQFSYINPECCSLQSFHPPSSMTDGQVFVKNIYETLRASPQWQNTLFILTFDENGGFADHVPPPVNVPAGDYVTYTETSPDGKPFTFDFSRLGVRVPAWLISPWVGKSVIEHQGQNNGLVYTHTSILAFLANLWGLDYLTPRVAFSSTFEHLILEEPRDTPAMLPMPLNF